MEANRQRKPGPGTPSRPGLAHGPEPPPPARPAASATGATSAVPDATREDGPPRTARDLSTVELVREITAEVTLLARKEIELARTELKANLKAEVMVVGGLSIAALAALCTINLLLVTAVLGLAMVLPGWGAGLIVSGITLVTTGIIAGLSWHKRVRKPLERTQRTLKDDVQWTKQRLV